MHYLDTSVVIALITPDRHTASVMDWLEGRRRGDVVASAWVVTETASALSLKQRAGTLDELARARAERSFELLISGGELGLLSVPSAAFANAAEMVRHWRLGLRGSDALHLAIAQHHGAVVATFDRAQAQAATELGIAVEPLFADT